MARPFFSLREVIDPCGPASLHCLSDWWSSWTWERDLHFDLSLAARLKNMAEQRREQKALVRSKINVYQNVQSWPAQTRRESDYITEVMCFVYTLLTMPHRMFSQYWPIPMTHVTTYMVCFMELLHNNINDLIVHVFSDGLHIFSPHLWIWIQYCLDSEWSYWSSVTDPLFQHWSIRMHIISVPYKLSADFFFPNFDRYWVFCACLCSHFY